MRELSIDDLVQIGRLTSVREDGFIRCISEIPVEQLSEVFLIFPDNRVFLVTICDHKLFGGKDFLRFEEPETAEEMRLVKQARMMLPPDEAPEDESAEYVGWRVIDGDSLTGEVIDAFSNGAHVVLEIRLNDDSVVMLPDVPEWISSRDDATQTLTAPRLSEFAGL